MMDPSRVFRSGWFGSAGQDGAVTWGGIHRRLVRRHVRRCLAAARRNRLPEAAVLAATRLATGPIAALPAPVAELVSMTLDELAP
jgi:hypothetical protein